MRIALAGTANSGKTTLVKAIEEGNTKIPPHHIINEIAGAFTKMERSKISTQLLILDKQIGQENNFVEKYHGFISDRSVIDNKAYLLWKYKNARGKASHSDIFGKYLSLYDSHMRQKPYDAIVFVNEYFPLVDNGIRELDDVMQKGVFEILQNLIPLECYIYHIPYYKMVGSTKERIFMLEKILKKYYTQKSVMEF